MQSLLELIPPASWRPFTYTMSWEPVTANSTEEDSFTVSSGYDFLLLAIGHTVATEADHVTEAPYPPFLIALRDTGLGGNNWQDNEVEFSVVSGRCSSALIAAGATAGFGPRVQIVPRLIKAGSTVTAALHNMDAAEDYGVWMGFVGVHIPKTL